MRGDGVLLGRAEQEAAGGGARVAVQHEEQQRVDEGVHEGDVKSHLPQFYVYVYAMFKAPVEHSEKVLEDREIFTNLCLKFLF